MFGAYAFYPPIYPSHRPKAGKHWRFCTFYPSKHPSQAVPDPSHPSQGRLNWLFLTSDLEIQPDSSMRHPLGNGGASPRTPYVFSQK